MARDDQPASFSRLLLVRAPARRSEARSIAGEDLVELGYPAEIALKDRALASFWQTRRLPGRPEAVVPSPRPRGYRTTSKRRVGLVGTVAHLFLGARTARRGGAVFVPSDLEPAVHADIYRFLQACLSETRFRLVAEHLRWVVVRGSYAAPALVLTVDTLFGPLVRTLKALGERLAASTLPVSAAFVYVDETASDYHLEARRPARGVGYKKLFGPDALRVDYGDLRLRLHPTSFCQVNESIVPRMLALADRMLEPRAGERLIDLYCGAGMFSLALAGRVGEVVGMDAARLSIEAARANARRLGHGATRFVAGRITRDAIERLPAPTGQEIVLLDPPRAGTARGVIEAIAARGPRRVLHVFCAVDAIPGALGAWGAAGYVPERIGPLDMFPGTPHLEVLTCLTTRSHRQRARSWSRGT